MEGANFMSISCFRKSNFALNFHCYMIRKSQRQPRVCLECSKRRIRCNKSIPCMNCIRRGHASECRREIVNVKGRILNSSPSEDVSKQIEPAKDYQEYSKKELLQKIDMLELQLANCVSIQDTSVVKKKDIDFYCSAVLYFTRDFDQKPTYLENFNFDSLHRLHFMITKNVSDKLIEYNLNKIYFIHTAVHPKTFLKEYEDFWNSSSPKHIDLTFDRSLESYLWTAIWYAMLCHSLYFLDTSIETELGYSSEQTYNLAQCCFFASIECLHRAQYLRCPDIKSIQAFCIFSACFHGFGGVHYKNNLIGCMLYIAKSLNLHQITDQGKMSTINLEIGCRLWWFLVIIDWLESTNRGFLISAEDFITPTPRNVRDDQLEYIVGQDIEESCFFEAISYNAFVIEISQLRKELHIQDEFDVSLTTLSSLKEAIRRIDAIETKWFTIMDRTPPNTILDFQRFLITIDISNQRFITNRSIISHISREEWVREYRHPAIDAALTILQFMNAEVPLYFRKCWVVTEQCISAAVFLLLDILIIKSDVDERIFPSLNMLLERLQVLSLYHVNVRKGIQIVKSLMNSIESMSPWEVDTINLDRLTDALKRLPEIYKDDANDYAIQRASINKSLEGTGWLDLVDIFFE